MEAFAAMTTAIFFWGFIYYLVTEAARRRRRLAGPLLLRLRHPRQQRLRKLAWGIVGFFVAMFLAFFVLALSVVDRVDPSDTGWVGFGAFVMLLHSVIIVRKLQENVEFRAYGVWYRRYTAWRDMKYVKWIGPGRLRVQWKTELGEVRVDPSQMTEATAVLVEHVEVRDATGEIPVELLECSTRTEAPEPPRVDPGRFQFSLTALLLLVLVASAAFSWYGIRYRKQQRAEEVLVEFERFHPHMGRQGTVVTQLDFSKSRVKPSDADLAELEHVLTMRSLILDGCPITDDGLVHIGRIRQLSWLDLRETDVTDAGLVHLEKLSRLRNLFLSGTEVTEAGVRRLKEKLPHVVVER